MNKVCINKNYTSQTIGTIIRIIDFSIIFYFEIELTQRMPWTNKTTSCRIRYQHRLRQYSRIFRLVMASFRSHPVQ